MKILIIGGTRNIGHLLALELLQHGHQVTVFNRGKTPDELPVEARRLHGDRSDPASLAGAFGRETFDAVIDMALYNETDAKQISRLLDGHIGQYIFISTGQVYLVRQNPQRPFTEEMYQNPVIKEPLEKRDYEEWLYGVEKSQAEDVLMQAYKTRRFPFTTLRLPMVNSERDHFSRIYNYLLRLHDGGPIILLDGDHWKLRHVYGDDVIQAILKALENPAAVGRAYNISQDETLSIEEFLTLMAELSGFSLKLVRVPRTLLEQHSLLPDCCPFSDPWMSELDNNRSKRELGIQYTPVEVYLQKLVSHYQSHPLPVPAGYRRRGEEIEWANKF